MGQNFLACERDQHWLMPPSLADWLPEDHLAWFVLDAVEQLDLRPFYACYRGDGRGRAAHDPAMMLALLVYAYCIGERSSRRIERRCQEDIAFRVITANQFPDHATIARFRVRHEQALRGLFVDVLRLCQRAGLVRVGVVALDSTKLAAPASLNANVSRERLEELVAAMVAEAAEVDAAEDRDEPPVDPPARLRGRDARRRRLAECQAQLVGEDAAAAAAHAEHLARRAAKESELGHKLRGRKPQPPRARPGRCNTSDPDSRMMKTAAGYLQGYNPQAMVTTDQIVVAAAASNEAADVVSFRPMLAKLADNLAALDLNEPVGVLLADAGYYSNANADAAPDGTELLIATSKDWKRSATSPRGRIPRRLLPMARMERRLRTERGRRLYRLRSQTVEPVFGQIKDIRGIRRFARRGLIAADSEWKLICATHNLLKLWRFQPVAA